ncbi:serine/threonine-protein kinase [Microcoleus sp. FACHB-68]|uniref:serine/threonine-protein kinase n=1 Tax=Microcoleus sp. FACHB-68 TaxID=2692826 RepID=UPI001684453B|nr:serine/threonine-protein kinase [Microcoleus sp. FACHB-68]MBD1938591.1 GUN4 domain-containing protein [Microcoleus sp. FACHB-68]
MSYWTPGQKLQNGKYIIADIIGSGGFGITYRAKEQPAGRILALKTLNHLTQQKGNFAKLQEDFVNEALCLAKCSHPHIAQVYRVFQEDELWCMAMEYIDGINLHEYQEDKGILPQHEALRIIRQMGEALTFVHERGFLHRDVKPANILLRRQNLDAVLIDFGLAREFTEGQIRIHTNSRTECFAPIEQYELKAERGAYTDVYALAATLYYVRTGKNPFPAEFRKEANIPLVSPKQYNPEIEDWENEAILEGMKLEAKDRPQTIKAWLELLKEDTDDLPLEESVQVLKEDTEDLLSEKGIDYRQLRDYLKAGSWKEADEETRRVMLKAANQKGFFSRESIDNFPCTDLRTIDQLWVKYSNGRFGFSVQKRLWLQAGGNIDYETECRLGDLVGWRVNGEWEDYDKLTFSLKTPEGHLPVCWRGLFAYGKCVWCAWGSWSASRLVKCNP